MKNRLEAELISIAHRILKLKNKSEIAQLQQETLNLYEKLSVLRFVEENYGDSSMEIPSDVEEKLENPTQQKEEKSTLSVTETIIEVKTEEIISEEVIEDDVQEKTLFEIEEKSEEIKTTEDTTISEENQIVSEEEEEEEEIIEQKITIEQTKEIKTIEFGFDTTFEDFEAQLSNAKPNKTPSIFDDVTSVKEPDFVPVQTTTIEQTEIKKTEVTVTETTKNISINDAVRKNFNIGLNDKIAFEFHLFGGKSEDFNRVLSQLNTFTSYEEAKDFIENIVKPDYNNWFMKDEYESRFLEIIESKFS